MRAMLSVHLEFNPVPSSTDAASAASDAIATDASSYTRESSLWSNLIIVPNEDTVKRTASSSCLVQVWRKWDDQWKAIYRVNENLEKETACACQDIGARGSRKVAGSTPDEVNDFFFFFNLANPSGRTRPWGSLSV
jgi:hypothetical protein